MTTELEQTRDHARAMSTAEHACLRRERPWVKLTPAPGCEGCVSEADRALWRAIADEIDAHLATADDEEALFP